MSQQTEVCAQTPQLRPHPLSADELHQLVALFGARRYSELEIKARELTARDPGSGLAWKVLGAALGVQGKDALLALRRAADLLPDDEEAHNNLGNALRSLGHFDAAVASCRRALELKSDFAEAHNNLGNALRGLGQLDAAAASCRRALELKPDFAEAHNNLGNALLELDRPEEAVGSYRRALELRPHYAEAHNNLGNALTRIALNPSYTVPDPNRDAHAEPEEREAALASYERAIALKPDYAEAYTNRANALVEFGQWDAARTDYDRAIALKPNFVGARQSRSMLLLLRGDFDAGWLEHEWRWKNDNGSLKVDRQLTQRRWRGEESIAGKTILLYGEQGLGDTLQFCRYVTSVAALGARVILDVQRPLASLMANLEGGAQIVARGDPVPYFDYQCPLMSLPLAFKTNLSTIPSSIKYLSADAAKVADWAFKLGHKTRARVGLVWRGNPTYKNDYKRSIPLRDFIRHLSVGPQYVSLHKDLSETDRQLLRTFGIASFADDLNDFSDTAALCDSMDLVVSVDTSVAHLSGALGKNTWIMLPLAPDWRWLLNRNDSPWYPTLGLYRQRRGGEWNGVLERIKTALIHAFELRMEHFSSTNHVPRH